MLRKIWLPTLALFGVMLVASPSPAKAESHFGVYLGAPAPGYVYPAPAYPAYPYGSYYAAPYYSSPYYAYPGYGFAFGFGGHDRDRREYRDHDRHEFRGGHEHFEHHDRR
jgi:hypothetical protein